MNLASWIAVGAFVGLLVGLLTRGLKWKSALFDGAVGVAGAVPCGWFLLPMSGNLDPGSVQLSGLLGALLGSAVLVAVSEIARP
jgi:uncharacterized membrane protein YeaQ/YmgE (transglycosylase-associated protein family)